MNHTHWGNIWKLLPSRIIDFWFSITNTLSSLLLFGQISYLSCFYSGRVYVVDPKCQFTSTNVIISCLNRAIQRLSYDKTTISNHKLITIFLYNYTDQWQSLWTFESWQWTWQADLLWTTTYCLTKTIYDKLTVNGNHINVESIFLKVTTMFPICFCKSNPN